MAESIVPQCVHCGAQFAPSKHGRRLFCSDACRLWSKVQKSDDGTCWVYTGPKMPKYKMGYGITTINGKSIGAHRAAYLFAVGEIPKGLFVCHKCDNPVCCNPAHLFLGTPNDNMQDKIAKGRQRPPTPEQIAKFLALRMTPEFEERRRLSSIGRRWAKSTPK